MHAALESDTCIGIAMDPPDQNVSTIMEQEFPGIRSKLEFYFRHNGCFDPADLADETISRAYGRLSGGAKLTAKLSSYVFGIAKNVLREYWKSHRETGLQEANIPSSVETAHKRVEQSVLIDRCLHGLCARDQQLLRAYFGDDDRADVAAEAGLSPNGLRIRVCRILKKVREDLAALGYARPESKAPQ